ncbi:hypothetical protein Tsubulata_035998 [Turnera subulata]|uniref:Protein POLYCHOME n=1 Tax=Turnera subulata TaxID=218843 RepID=A0A9Q0IZM0_9ROSI|nr:hypothetical protein Tsubulata_033694 [Turnera subulata]KAJ4827541.1 hypothetical protein Tsubulata_035998 [Turnera subulata]
MPESRDRLSRPVDYGALLARTVAAQIYQDPPEIHAAAVSGSPGPNANARAAAVGGRGRGGFGTPRAQLGRGTRTALSPSPGTGRENVPPPGSARRGRGRGSPSPLPSWYPRTPLRDITAVVRAIERRRDRLRGSDGQETRSPLSFPAAAHQDHSRGFMSPSPTLQVKRCPPTVGKVSKILLDIASPAPGDSESLTPQKKLLDSIDTVEKVVLEELQKLKRTPSAKKAERERRVRTLMSMR